MVFSFRIDFLQKSHIYSNFGKFDFMIRVLNKKNLYRIKNNFRLGYGYLEKKNRPIVWQPTLPYSVSFRKKLQ